MGRVGIWLGKSMLKAWLGIVRATLVQGKECVCIYVYLEFRDREGP